MSCVSTYRVFHTYDLDNITFQAFSCRDLARFFSHKMASQKNLRNDGCFPLNKLVPMFQGYGRGYSCNVHGFRFLVAPVGVIQESICTRLMPHVRPLRIQHDAQRAGLQ